MYSYTVFGVGLECPFELPELDTSTVPPTQRWRVEEAHGSPPAAPLTSIGTETVFGAVSVRSSVSPGLVRLAFDDTGTFDVLPPARVIRWYRGPDSRISAVRADLLGRVLSMAVHHDGALVLHASAVSVDDGVVAFLGPKQAGKSTLATALVRRGARLVTDDTLVVRFRGDFAVAVPGIQRVRLWPDSARAVGATALSGEGTKPTIDDLGADSREDADKPLVACYVLQPVPDANRLARRRLSEVHAALAGVGFSKLGGLAGGRFAVEVLERSTRLAQIVPVYAAEVPRDLAQLQDVASDIMAWHRTSTPNVVSR